MDYEDLRSDKKKAGTCIYHATEKPKVVYIEDAQEWFDKGWKDSPALFLNLKESGVDPENKMQVRDVAAKVRGIVEAVNGAVNLEAMGKAELIEYGKKHCNVNLSAPIISNKRRVFIIQSLIDGKTHKELGVKYWEHTIDEKKIQVRKIDDNSSKTDN